MKHSLIRYQLAHQSEEAWHRTVTEFIAALDGDPELQGKVAYRCLRVRDGRDYFHLAAAADDDSVKLLQSRDYFKRYTALTREAAAGEVVVSPLVVVAETALRA